MKEHGMQRPQRRFRLNDWRITRKLRCFATLVLITGCILPLLAGAPVSADDPTFGIRRGFGTGKDLNGRAAVGDMDGDGDLDLVIGNAGANGVTASPDMVFLNDGQGNFYTGPVECGVTDPLRVRCFGTGTEDTASVAVGDVNNDGFLDIVSGVRQSCADVCADPAQDVVYLNDGAGNFYNGPVTCGSTERVRCFGTGKDNASIVTLGDINSDGSLDIVSGNLGQLDFVFYNNGQGGFYNGPVNNCGSNREQFHCFGDGADPTASVGVADINRDGALDLVVGNGRAGSSSKQSAVYLQNRANPNQPFFLDQLTADNCNSFTAYLRCFGASSARTRGMAVGHINNDEYLDIVAGNQGQQSFVYLNDGTDHFPTAQAFGAPLDETESVTLADVNSDGRPDLVASNASQQDYVYLNNGSGSFPAQNYRFGTATEAVGGVSAADVDGDLDLDLIVGNPGPDAIYLNDGAGALPATSRHLFGSPANTRSVAVGDMNRDGQLDLIVGNYGQQSFVYLNNGQNAFTPLAFGPNNGATTSIAVADVDGDNNLDIITTNNGSGQRNVVYRNNGAGGFVANDINTEAKTTESVAVGDVDGDGDLDAVIGNQTGANSVFLNNGGNIATGDARGFPEGNTRSVALGDVDRDGDLDIVAGNARSFDEVGKYYYRGQDFVYLNNGVGQFYGGDPLNECGQQSNVRCFGTGTDDTRSIALGDIDGDSDLDIVSGNAGEENTVWLNDGAGNFLFGRAIATAAANTQSVALGDMDGDRDLDLVAGNQGQQNVVYVNDGTGNFAARRTFGAGSDATLSVAVGDMNRDGTLDLVTGNTGQQSAVYLNPQLRSAYPANDPPSVTLTRPAGIPNANFVSTPAILDSPQIMIPYTLTDPEGDPVRFIRAYYSPDGGGRWIPAVAASGAITTNLATSPIGIGHTFVWDTFASGFFGQSDNVVFRIEAYPTLKPQPNRVAGSYELPYRATQTFPFRVRGTQVRVMRGDQPVAGAVVHRLPSGQSRGAKPLADGSGQPFHTNALGYLEGRGELGLEDRLLALVPISTTTTYTIYNTSGAANDTGLPSYEVRQSGVQRLTVSAAQQLTLFNLDISLEWDARRDTQFMSQLQFDLQRTSEFLYDWTDGQVALGNLKIYHDKQKWSNAHIRIYASNRLRPNATQGGISSDLVAEDITKPDGTIIRNTYAPGQVRMAAVWNRFGEPGGNLSEDWPRTLAHELGHFLFFLDDNYLGLDTNNNVLFPVKTCPGPMSDPYRDDWSEFHPDAGWLPECRDTLSNQRTGRSDWSTISTFYPWLNKPGASFTNTGPSSLALDVTRIVVEPFTATATLDVPIFYLMDNDGRSVQPGSSARAFLFQGDHLIDLGRPTQDQVLARGARQSDRVCVYELDQRRLGCELVKVGDEELVLVAQLNWQPDVIVTPVTSRTVDIEVRAVEGGRTLRARFFPMSAPATTPITLTQEADGAYTGSFKLLDPALEGYVQVWVDEGEPRREIVVDYALGGNPGYRRDREGYRRDREAPGTSPDGQVMLYADNLNFGDGHFFTLQAAAKIPSVPRGQVVVGRAYHLVATPGVNLTGASIGFSYLGSDVPLGREAGLQVYYYLPAQGWQPLLTKQDLYHNFASAQVQNPGLYALMTSVIQGWNMIAYPVQGDAPEATIAEQLRSLEGSYSTVYGHNPGNTTVPWQRYGVDAPAWVNTLTRLEYGRAYWINITGSIMSAPQGSRPRDNVPQASIPQPPTTFYGEVLPGPDFAPAEGMTILARVNDIVCGRAQTQQRDGKIVYVVDVEADDGDGYAGCGVPGRLVTFEVNSRKVSSTAAWDNNSLRELSLNTSLNTIPQQRVFLPFIVRN